MTAAPEPRRFHLSLRRILPLLAGCFLFVGAGAWMILHASAAPSLILFPKVCLEKDK